MNPRTRQPLAARVLVVDDNAAIHDDFRKIFVSTVNGELEELEASLFGERPSPSIAASVDLAFASQGTEAVSLVERDLAGGRTFDVAFVDVRMPPGIDGVETVVRLWRIDPRMQIVMCTAYSDYSWEEMATRLGAADSFLILKKPFDRVEARQLVQSLTEKRALLLERESRLEELDRLIRERTDELAQANASLALEMKQRLKTEQQLHQSQKLEALGRLAACMGHEINNPLSYVLANVEQAGIMVGDQEPLGSEERLELRTMLEEAASGVNRIALLVRHLKVFSRAQPQPSRPFAVNAVIDSAFTLVRNEIRHRASLVLDLASDLPEVVGEAHRLEQVLVNLLINAVQSIPPGDAEGNRIKVTTQTGGAGEVVIAVSDTGCGIAPDDLERVFEAFYTTKPVGEGTGLGLAICHSIVQAHGGRIAIDSTVGSGTTVTVALPSAQPHAG
jgi:two-component system, NtrC family, sensor kinase